MLIGVQEADEAVQRPSLTAVPVKLAGIGGSLEAHLQYLDKYENPCLRAAGHSLHKESHLV